MSEKYGFSDKKEINKQEVLLLRHVEVKKKREEGKTKIPAGKKLEEQNIPSSPSPHTQNYSFRKTAIHYTDRRGNP